MEVEVSTDFSHRIAHDAMSRCRASQRIPWPLFPSPAYAAFVACLDKSGCHGHGVPYQLEHINLPYPSSSLTISCMAHSAPSPQPPSPQSYSPPIILSANPRERRATECPRRLVVTAADANLDLALTSTRRVRGESIAPARPLGAACCFLCVMLSSSAQNRCESAVTARAAAAGGATVRWSGVSVR